MRANQQAIAEMGALLKRGLRELEDAFRDILRESCRQTIVPLEYVMKSSGPTARVLHLIDDRR